jgi:cobalt-zinc-cadmium efflux system outer membrane protein
VLDVQGAFVDMQAAKDSLHLAQENLQTLHDVVDINEKRLKNGDLAKVELLQARVAEPTVRELCVLGRPQRSKHLTQDCKSDSDRCTTTTGPGGFVRKVLTRLYVWMFLITTFVKCGLAQQPLTWAELRDKFETTNPTLIADRIGINQSKAAEVTAYLRPNPTATGLLDQINPFTKQPPVSGEGENSYSPFRYALPFGSIDYLHERQHKRELRRDSAQQATTIAMSQVADQERGLLFNLRGAFVETLQQKAILALAEENLSYFDQVLKVSRDRRQLGDISQVDLDRLEVQRVQYETDLQTATVNLRTAKIQLLTLLNDRTPVERFDVTGPYEFPDRIPALGELHKIALDTRPDLRAAVQSIDRAKVDNRLAWANGSTDPTFGVDFGHNPPIPAYFGISVTIPLRIFDRNQGEKARTLLDISRNQQLRDATEAQVFGDVDSAYAIINSNLTLLKTYKANYLQRAMRARDTILFSYQNGGASLLDFLQAQQEYRSVRVNYLNLIGAYLTSAAQMNLAVGREVIQ